MGSWPYRHYDCRSHPNASGSCRRRRWAERTRATVCLCGTQSTNACPFQRTQVFTLAQSLSEQKHSYFTAATAPPKHFTSCFKHNGLHVMPGRAHLSWPPLPDVHEVQRASQELSNVRKDSTHFAGSRCGPGSPPSRQFLQEATK